MIPETIPNPQTVAVTNADACAISTRWGIPVALFERVARARADLPFDIWIFSGRRFPGEQSGVSTTAFDLSTHASHDRNGCPRLATGIDLQPVSPAVRLSGMAVAQLGAAMVRQGFRWGGGAPVGSDGIPVGNERWHFDLGPRSETG